jgi:hypothetical protein
MKDIGAEQTLRSLALEKEIRNYFGQDSNHEINFRYLERDNNIQLNVETINPRYNQMFLFHSVTGVDRGDALEKMLEYVKHYRTETHSYTIQWSDHDSRGVRTSYFQAHSIEEALEKFRYGRDRNKTTIFLISLNPES